MPARPGAPCLRPEISIIQQVFRGETSFVVKNPSAQKYLRFGAAEVRVLRAFDGRHTPDQIAAALAGEGMRISAAAVESFARTMAAAGFLERALEERTTLQMERLRAERHQRHRPALFRGELLRMRWSFGDPDALLTRSLPYVDWMFSRTFALLSVAVFLVYSALLGARWGEFERALVSTYSFHTITLTNVLVLWVTGAAVILIHELGHGYACKHYGGEVRELGFMLIYFQPAFYCNVSDAWSFPERRARLWVTAAGGWIQLVVASVAAIVWWVVAPNTLVSNVAVAAMLIGGATTLLTNANPLLPLDGYFAFTDWMEIPNLRLRAFAHFRWWVQEKLLRLDTPEPPATRRERRVFLIYGAIATLYTTLLLGFIAVLVVGWSRQAFGVAGAFVTSVALGVLMRHRIAGWMRGVVLGVRVRRDNLRRLRRPAWFAAAIALLLLLFVPWTLTSPGDFVVGPVGARVVSSPERGVVTQTFVREGTHVEAGMPLLRLVNHDLERSILAVTRAVDSLAMGESVARSSGRSGEASRLAAERGEAEAELAGLERRASSLVLRASSAGIVTTPHAEELVGRLVAASDTVLTLSAGDSVEVRIALAGAGATRVRPGQIVHAISFADPGAPWTAQVGDVSTVGLPSVGTEGAVEARLRRPSDDAWRPGTRGEASVELGRSNVLGALWWNARQLLRADLLL
jgi:multidrug efflux pump subunit AcrA (membrane-fusion protein)